MEMTITHSNLSIRGVYTQLLSIVDDTKLEVIRKLAVVLPESIVFEVVITKPGYEAYANITITSVYHSDNDFTQYLGKVKEAFTTDYRNINSVEDGYKFHTMVFHDKTTKPNVGSLYDNTYSWHLYQEETEFELFIMRKPDKKFVEALL